MIMVSYVYFAAAVVTCVAGAGLLAAFATLLYQLGSIDEACDCDDCRSAGELYR